MDEIIFVVTAAPEGGYTARALGQCIFTEADDLATLRDRVWNAVRCHFDEGDAPGVIRLHSAHGDVLAIRLTCQSGWMAFRLSSLVSRLYALVS